MDLHVVEIIGLLVLGLAALARSPREKTPEPVRVRIDDEPAPR